MLGLSFVASMAAYPTHSVLSIHRLRDQAVALHEQAKASLLADDGTQTVQSVAAIAQLRKRLDLRVRRLESTRFAHDRNAHRP